MFARHVSVTVSCVFESPLPSLAFDPVDHGKPLFGITALSLMLVKAAVFHLSLARAEFFQPQLSIDVSFDQFDLFLEFLGKCSWAHPKVSPSFYILRSLGILLFILFLDKPRLPVTYHSLHSNATVGNEDVPTICIFSQS
jgi:hypothetical protein